MVYYIIYFTFVHENSPTALLRYRDIGKINIPNKYKIPILHLLFCDNPKAKTNNYDKHNYKRGVIILIPLMVQLYSNWKPYMFETTFSLVFIFRTIINKIESLCVIIRLQPVPKPMGHKKNRVYPTYNTLNYNTWKDHLL